MPAAQKISLKIQSAGETHRCTFRNNRRFVRRSQRNFAGQNEARSMQPVWPWIFLSSNSSLNRAASVAQRESAQVKIGVSGPPFRSRARRPCQKALPPTAPIGILRREAASVSRRHPCTARRSPNGESSAPPSAVYRSEYCRRASVPRRASPRSLKRALRVEELPMSRARTSTAARSTYLSCANKAGRRLSCAVNAAMARRVGGLMWCSMPSTS